MKHYFKTQVLILFWASLAVWYLKWGFLSEEDGRKRILHSYLKFKFIKNHTRPFSYSLCEEEIDNHKSYSISIPVIIIKLALKPVKNDSKALGPFKRIFALSY